MNIFLHIHTTPVKPGTLGEKINKKKKLTRMCSSLCMVLLMSIDMGYLHSIGRGVE